MSEAATPSPAQNGLKPPPEPHASPCGVLNLVALPVRSAANAVNGYTVDERTAGTKSRATRVWLVMKETIEAAATDGNRNISGIALCVLVRRYQRCPKFPHAREIQSKSATSELRILSGKGSSCWV